MQLRVESRSSGFGGDIILSAQVFCHNYLAAAFDGFALFVELVGDAAEFAEGDMVEVLHSCRAASHTLYHIPLNNAPARGGNASLRSQQFAHRRLATGLRLFQGRGAGTRRGFFAVPLQQGVQFLTQFGELRQAHLAAAVHAVAGINGEFALVVDVAAGKQDMQLFDVLLSGFHL